METIKKLLDLLSVHERKEASLLLLMILVMALLDMIGVASILPFIAVLTNPQLVESNQLLATLYSVGNFQNIEEFFFALGLIVFLILCLSLIFKALTIYSQLRFALLREYTIGRRLIEGYLHQPYSWFLNRHSSDLGKNILSEVGAVISGGIMPMITVIAQGAVTISLTVLLLIVDPLLSMLVALVLGSLYTLVYKSISKYLDFIGIERLKANQDRFNAVSEAFGASKEVKLGALESIYLKRFSKPAQTYAYNQATAQVVAQIPRFALEGIAFGGLLLVVLYLMIQSNTFAETLPLIALYAFAGYRLLPALQQIYASLTQLRFARPALNALHSDFMGLKPIEKISDTTKFNFKKNIVLSNISYSYPNSERTALTDINIDIYSNSTVGIVGMTGSGKTSTVDIILGLLVPQKGSLQVDGKIISERNKRAWQKTIGYVPQQIYLIDDTIAANIAFGIEPQNIDEDALIRAAKMSNLHDFIINELSSGYKTVVGERGVRLSGGQRQRIAIARALYHKPKVLVFDEATSALDNLTEKIIMEAVHNLGDKITVILIAHRLSTVKVCDNIYFLENGRVRSQGSFDTLRNKDEKFRKMADV